MDLIRGIALILAAGSAVAAVLSLGGAVSNRLDILTHLAPIWLAMSLLAVLLLGLAGFSGGRAALVLAGVTVVIAAALMVPELVARVAARRFAPAGQTVKIVQFNVWDHNRDPAATAGWILAQNADIVVLEETGRGDVVAKLSDHFAYQSQCDKTCGTTILAKSQPTDGGQLIWAKLGRRHAGAWATFGAGARAFTIVGTHYRWPEPLARQKDQALRFADVISRFDRRSLIVVGDFNLTPWSFRLRRQDARFGLNRLSHAIFTFPAGRSGHWWTSLPFPLLPIDQVYAGADWRPVSIARGQAMGSDHYPIVAVLTR
ncbi:MAG TPA: endonuclease/exonuclease/phosphatase family protein [Caulobacteraceae bacterium]|jgi:endonuclease/exonuclease/phosphatase (EEP) superfamily protein YafD